MATGMLSRTMDCLRAATLRSEGASMTDGQLLDCFLTHRDEAAISALLRRHGPMVMGVCRRVTGNSHDAEDAFQATFLVLVRKAASIVPREMVGNWLYGVAYRTATKARSVSARRRGKEKQVKVMPEATVLPPEDNHELQALLDRELNRLPDKYRLPIVLCDLEGRTRREVARQLHVPDGTLSNRLSAARRILAKRLTGRGLAVSGGMLAAILSQKAFAGVPAALHVSTVKAATLVAAGGAATSVVSATVATLSSGVLKAMFLTKLKSITTILLVAGLCIGGAGVVTQPALADKPAQPAVGDKAAKPVKPEKPTADEVNGPVKAVDAGKNTITLLVNVTKSSPGEDKTFDVTADAKIAVDGKLVKLADVTTKMVVTLTLKDAKVVAIRTAEKNTGDKGGSVHGVLKSEDAVKNTITLTIPGAKNQSAEDKTFDVSADAKIVIDNSKVVKLADLPLGVQINLSMGKDQKVAGISAVGPSVSGHLKAVDATKNTITVAVNSGMKGVPPEDKTFDVAKDARISIDKTKEPKALSDLTQGNPVSLTLSVDQKSAIAIFSKTPQPESSNVRGEVTAVDAAKDSLTLTLPKGKGAPGETQSFTIPKEAKILIDLDQAAKLGDLKNGAIVTVDMSPEGKIVSVKAVGPTVPGVLKSVDGTKNVLTATVNPTKNSPGEDKDYTLAKEAKIWMGKGQAVKLGDLNPGVRVNLMMSMDQKSVIGVSVVQE